MRILTYSVKRSFKLANNCWSYLLMNKDLFLFVVLNIIANLVVCLCILTLIKVPGLEYFGSRQPLHMVINYELPAAVFIIYFCLFFIGTFFNAALIYCISQRMTQQDCTPSQAIFACLKYIPSLLAWSLIAVTVGIVLKTARSIYRANGTTFLRNMYVVTYPFEYLFDFASYFILPFIVNDKLNIVDAIKQAKKVMLTKGKAYFGLGAVMFTAGLLLIIISIGISKLLMAFFPQYSFDIAIGMGTCLFLFFISFGVVLSAIMKSALYLFYIKGQVTPLFEDVFPILSLAKEKEQL